jgi:hypothetical protein
MQLPLRVLRGAGVAFLSVSMNADASRFVIDWRDAGTVRPIDLQTARIMFNCFSEARFDGSVMLPPSVCRVVILSTFCISSRDGRFVQSDEAKSQSARARPIADVAAFSIWLVLLTLFDPRISSAKSVATGGIFAVNIDVGLDDDAVTFECD